MINYKIKRSLILLGVFLFFTPPVFSQNYYKLTPDLKRAYDNIIMLKLDRGQEILDSLKIFQPENMAVYHIENYIDFFRVFINEDYNEFSRLEENKKRRLDKLKTINKNSPFYKFSMAEVNLQWAFSRLKFEEYFTVLREINTAYDLLQENNELFPEFVVNNKSLSIIHAIIGTLPDTYKSLLKLFSGLDGTIDQAAKEISGVLEFSKKHNYFFKDESFTIASYIALYLENDSQKAWKIIEEADLNIENSPLACFVYANIAMRTGRNDLAIEILEKVPKGDDRLSFVYLDYMLGCSKLYKMDINASYYLRSFVENFHGRNYIKDAYLKIAWFELIVNNNEAGYWENIEKCLSQGEKIVDEDKSAYKEAMNADIPNRILLKARLYFDGAYYLKAYTFLIQYEDKFMNSGKNILEFNYRMGRILQALNSMDAIYYFQKTIDIGRNSGLYFACNAALQSGIIYEKMKNYNKAKEYFKLCLKSIPDEYKTSLHQKANSGLMRIK
ncbi:MAG TPA: hypothetical protein ENI82_06310, partial [Bacteroidetes bacterium]|nr:hypothetical protein [Bacteroidota bacterium]